MSDRQFLPHRMPVDKPENFSPHTSVSDFFPPRDAGVRTPVNGCTEHIDYSRFDVPKSEFVLVESNKQYDTKLTNPKDVIGSSKLPLHLWPETASALGCLALLDGALKYGRANWRVAGVRASIYVDAAKRHLNKWFEGQDDDPDSGLPHFAHALACLAILVDAEAAGMLNDDRQVKGGFIEMLDNLTPHVERLKAVHAHRTPKHYTIADDQD